MSVNGARDGRRSLIFELCVWRSVRKKIIGKSPGIITVYGHIKKIIVRNMADSRRK